MNDTENGVVKKENSHKKISLFLFFSFFPYNLATFFTVDMNAVVVSFFLMSHI